MRRLVALAALAGLFAVTGWLGAGPAPGATPTLVAGLVLLIGHVAGHAMTILGLPRITGYLASGLVLGPHVLAVISEPVGQQLFFLNQLAIAFIALAAGAELHVSQLRARAGLIGWLVAATTGIVLVGVALVVFFVGPSMLPFAAGLTPIQMAAVATLLGVIAVARSPSSALAVIRECDAHGPFSETALGVTVAIDVVVIVLFAVVLATCEVLLSPGAALDVDFALSVLLELTAGIASGAVIGLVLSFYIARWPANIALLLLGTALVVTEIAHGTAHYVQATHELPLRLEPLLICVTAGFVVRNVGNSGDAFAHAVERVSLPVFVLFFTLAGAALDLQALRRTWAAALTLVLVRAGSILGAGWAGAAVAGDQSRGRRLYGCTFLTQAGISIGLALEVVRRFPEWGEAFATVVVAAISINQIIGPVAMKFALQRVGEARSTRPAA